MNQARMRYARIEGTWMERFVVASNVASGLLLSSGLTACAIYLLLALAPLVWTRPSQIEPPPFPAGA